MNQCYDMNQFYKELQNFSVSKKDLDIIKGELKSLREQDYFSLNEYLKEDIGSRTLAIYSTHYKKTKRYKTYPSNPDDADWCEPIVSICPVLTNNLKILKEITNFKRAILHYSVPGYIQNWHIDYTGPDQMSRMLHFWLQKPECAHTIWRKDGILYKDKFIEGKAYFYNYGIEHMGYNFSNSPRHFVSIHLDD